MASHADLRSGTSLWQAIGAAPLPCPHIDESICCEVAIVGAGITGALIGHMLSRAGVDTVLVDKGPIGTGSTAASTGLLQYEVDTPLVDLIGKVGESNAVHAYRRGLRAIDELEGLTRDLQGDVGFARRSTLCLASSEADRADLRREYDCRRHFGFDVGFWERGSMRDRFGLNAPAALYSQGDAEVNPYALTQLLVCRARENGMRAFEGVAIETVIERPGRVMLLSKSGCVEARAAVLATGYAANLLLPSNFCDLQTTYAVASERLAEIPYWPERCLIWETARPYFYARQTPEGRVLIGGEDTPFADDHQDPALLHQKADRLQRRFRELFPAANFRPACAWAGTFAETRDGLPYIGRPPHSEQVYLALGYGGNGITFSMIAATLLRDLIVGRTNGDAAVFGFTRPPA